MVIQSGGTNNKSETPSKTLKRIWTSNAHTNTEIRERCTYSFFLRGQMTRLMYVATGVERHPSFCPRQKI